jgi:predicted amidohydrolase YtcJ
MRLENVAPAILFGSALLAAGTDVAAQQPAQINQADSVLYNGKIVTVDGNFSIAEAVAIREGKFIAVGTDRDVRALAGSKTTSVDLKGRTVLPGLIDSHAHLEAGGIAEYTVSLERARSVAEALAIIKEIATKRPPGQWILGGRWDPLSQLAEHRYLTRTEIDSVAPVNPVYLRVSHFAMANSAALKLAGISKDTPNPSGGEIEKDNRTGEPTGVLAESAWKLVADAVPPWPFEVRVSQLKKAMTLFNSFGLTSVVSGNVNPSYFSAHQYIRAHNEQTIRVSAMFTPTGETIPSISIKDWERFFDEVGASSDFGDDWLTYPAIKLSTPG